MASVEQLAEIRDARSPLTLSANPPPLRPRRPPLPHRWNISPSAPYSSAAASTTSPRSRIADRALVLGDGDGRFLARLLAVTPNLHADAVDASPVMLRLLSTRIARLDARSRLTTTCADARTFQPSAPATTSSVHTSSSIASPPVRSRPSHRPASARISLPARNGSSPNSRFPPAAGTMRAWIAAPSSPSLYAAFRLLTGLTVRQIPPWPALLARHGFRRRSTRSWLGGLLVSEVWELPQATAPQARRSHK